MFGRKKESTSTVAVIEPPPGAPTELEKARERVFETDRILHAADQVLRDWQSKRTAIIGGEPVLSPADFETRAGLLARQAAAKRERNRAHAAYAKLKSLE